MKYTGRKMSVDAVGLQTSVQSWLGHELEIRGIDAVIYTRYILSILQQDPVDTELGEAEFFPPSKKGISIPSRQSRLAVKSKKAERKKSSEVTSEMMKKSAAVECLLSVSDEASGIESLVEELYCKLKEQEAKTAFELAQYLPDSHDNYNSLGSSPPDDPAERYYAAFPALSEKTANSAQMPPEDCIWARVAQKALSSSSSGEDSSPEREQHDATRAKRKGRVGHSEPDQAADDPTPTRRKDQSEKDNEDSKKVSTNTSGERKGRRSTNESSDHKERHQRNGFTKEDKGDTVASGIKKVDAEKIYLSNKAELESKFVRAERGKLPGQNVEEKGKKEERVLNPSKNNGLSTSGKAKEKASWVEFDLPKPTFIVPKMPSGKKLGYKVSRPPSGTEYGFFNLGSSDEDSFDEFDLMEVLGLKKKENEEKNPWRRSIPENQDWYTQPLEMLVPMSPAPTRRLYRRQSSTVIDLDLNFPYIIDDFLKADGEQNEDGTVKRIHLPRYLLHIQNQASAKEIKHTDELCPSTPMTQGHEISEEGKILTEDTLCQTENDAETTAQEEHEAKRESPTFSLVSDQLEALDKPHWKEGSIGTAEGDTCCTSCSCGNDEEGENVGSHTNGLVDKSSPTFRVNIPESTENEVLDHRPLGQPVLYISTVPSIQLVDTGFKSQHMDNVSDSSEAATVERHISECQSQALQSVGDFKSPFDKAYSQWPKHLQSTEEDLALDGIDILQLSCDSCKSNINYLDNQDFWDISSLSSGKPGIWSSFLDTIVPSSTEGLIQNRSTWQELHVGDMTYDDDRPWGDIGRSLSLLLSPSQDGRTSQLWNVNIHGKYEFECPRERSSTIENIQRHLFNIKFDGPETRKGQQNFIQGGLYGNVINAEDEIWNSSSDFDSESKDGDDNVFSDPQGNSPTLSWSSLSMRLFPRQRSTSADYACDAEKAPPGKFARSVEIKASENSAFRNIIPRQTCHLLHVKSEPALNLGRLMGQDSLAGPQARFVQVQSLYKSESSILKQLGLIGYDDSDKVAVDFSPETHFRPIRTPQNSPEDGAAASNAGTVTPVVQESELPSPEIIRPCSNYQLYQGEETLGEQRRPFIPRFKLEKGREKYIQTSDSVDREIPPDEEGPEEEKTAETKGNNADLERLLSVDMQTELELSKEDAQRFAMEDMDNYEFFTESPVCGGGGQDCSSDYESMAPDQSLEELHSTHLAELWEAGQDSSDGADETQAFNQYQYRSIWSTGHESYIPSVPDNYATVAEHSEFSYPYDYVYEYSVGDISEDIIPMWSTAEDELQMGDEAVIIQVEGQKDEEPQWMDDPNMAIPDEYKEAFHDCVEQAYNAEDTEHSQRQIHFSSDLEEQWMNADSTFEVQVPRRHRRLNFAPQKKPCSFFLEGNCRRADCKFAHDVSNITCRFWEDGGCFKGVTCPFLHGYPSSSKDSNCEARSMPDYKTKFQFDEEDFPELSKSQEYDRSASKATENLVGHRRQNSLSEKPHIIFPTNQSKKEKAKFKTK